VNETVGRVRGDKNQEMKGEGQQMKGGAKQAAGHLRSAGKKAKDSVKNTLGR
jgi:uncharacterized protein YjbJ (UPF0337 family)